MKTDSYFGKNLTGQEIVGRWRRLDHIVKTVIGLIFTYSIIYYQIRRCEKSYSHSVRTSRRKFLKIWLYLLTAFSLLTIIVNHVNWSPAILNTLSESTIIIDRDSYFRQGLKELTEKYTCILVRYTYRKSTIRLLLKTSSFIGYH